MYEVNIMNRAERRLQQKIENKQAKKADNETKRLIK